MTRWMMRERWLDFLLPTGCVSCRAWIPLSEARSAIRTLLCTRCRSRLASGSWPRCPRCRAPRGTGRSTAADCMECRGWSGDLTSACFAWIMTPPATDLVHALKYEGWRELAGFMGASMADALRASGMARASAPSRASAARDAGKGTAPGMMVVPVPTTAERARQRGYNQARLLAEVVADGLRLPLRDALMRRGGGASQTALSPEDRRENVRGAFAPVGEGRGIDLEGRHVLLVDDVLTTGATACEAASTLLRAGAAEVRLVTFARALPGRDAGTRSAA